MGFININNQKFTYSQLPNLKLGNLTEDALQTIRFCKEWILGKNEFVFHTSGSTGKPNSIFLSRNQLLVSAQTTNTYLNLHEQDHFLVGMNTKMIAGTMMLVRAIEADASVTVIKPTGNPLLEYLENVHTASEALPTFTAMVPLQMQNVLEGNQSKILDLLQQMKAVLIGGGDIHYSLEEKIRQLTCPVFHTYGMTETVSHIALRKINGDEGNINYKVLPNVEIKVSKKQCLMIKAPMTNYAWLTTNDKVELLDKSTFKWIGRVDNVINSGGVKIQIEQLESKIAKYLDELNRDTIFFIAGIPDKKLGQKVCLFIEGRGTIFNTLKNTLKEYLDRYEMPKSIIYLDVFPLTLSGKIDKQRIIRLHSSG